MKSTNIKWSNAPSLTAMHELPPAHPLAHDPVVMCSLIVKATICFHSGSKDGVSLEWEQGSEEWRLADGRQTKPDAMSCSGFPKGLLPSTWAVTQYNTYTHIHTLARKSDPPAGVFVCARCLTECLYMSIVCFLSLINKPVYVASVGGQLRLNTCARLYLFIFY